MAEITQYDEILEVRRTGAGCYEIPGASEPEDRHATLTEMEPAEVEDYGELAGWGPWKRVYRVVDADGVERWYFARPAPLTIAQRAPRSATPSAAQSSACSIGRSQR